MAFTLPPPPPLPPALPAFTGPLEVARIGPAHGAAIGDPYRQQRLDFQDAGKAWLAGASLKGGAEVLAVRDRLFHDIAVPIAGSQVWVVNARQRLTDLWAPAINANTGAVLGVLDRINGIIHRELRQRQLPIEHVRDRIHDHIAAAVRAAQGLL